MGKANIGNWLLTVGTVLGALGAANSHKSGKWVELENGQAVTGEYLLHPLVGEGGAELLAAGTELDAATVDTLIANGKEKVFARVPAQPIDVVEGLEALTGRTLFEDIVLSKETKDLEKGHELGFVDLRELRESGVTEVLVEGEEGPQPIGAPGTYELRGKKLSEPFRFELPDKLKAGSFVTDDDAQRIVAAGIGEVKVKVNKKFSFEDWDARLLFFAGILCMVGGIALKRAVPTGEDGEEGASESISEVRRRLEEVTRATAALAERVDSLDAAEIHAEVDPIIVEGCLPIVEGRTAIIGALGMGGFANVMSSFSSGERRLNRAWSAAVDDYVDEARAAVRDAVPHLEAALAALG